jgi:predicted amidohydrolase YtcJ
LVDQIGSQVYLHDITDDAVSNAVEARRQCVKKAGRIALASSFIAP